MNNPLVPVPSAVYNNRNVIPGSYYQKCLEDDILTRLHPLMKGAGYYLSYDGNYKRLAISVGVDTPWHHVKHLRTKKCGIDHNVKFDGFGYIPPRCLECWKVVVYPRTLKELFLLLDVEKGLNRACKCGIDVRNYAPGLYNGFFYNDSLEEGRFRYEEVRKAVDEHIGPDVKVILKRGCTEYEMVIGPSPAWHMTRKQHELDERLETLIDTSSPNIVGQTPECIAQVHSRWIEWAFKHQDPTVHEYLGDEPLYPPCVCYHEGDLGGIKADLTRAKAKVKHDIDPDVVDAIHASLRGFEMTKRVTPEKLGAVLGFESINPLYAGGCDVGYPKNPI